MSLPVLKISSGSTIPVRPFGGLLNGWLPGTLVNFTCDQRDTTSRSLYVDLAARFPDNMGVGGFTMSGSLILGGGFDRRHPNNNEPSGYWTADEQIQYAKGDENRVIEFDDRRQLSHIGKDILTINHEGGNFKVFTFEKYDEDFLSSDGASGDIIDWRASVGKPLGVSSRSLFTTIDNNVLSQPCEYRLGGFFSGENGIDYIIIIRK